MDKKNPDTTESQDTPSSRNSVEKPEFPVSDDAKLQNGSASTPSLTELNAETGVLSWQDLVRYFARGVVVKVSASLDLVQVAGCVAADDTEAFNLWLERGLVARATDDDARDWNVREPSFWCLVTAPWVLVQETEPPSKLNEAKSADGSTSEANPAPRTLH